MMAFSKQHLFDSEDRYLASTGRALGHPARLQILRILHRKGPMHVKQIAAMLPLSEGAVCAHLRKLLRAGLLHVKVDRLMNFYHVDYNGLAMKFERLFSLERSLLSGNSAGNGNSPVTTFRM